MFNHLPWYTERRNDLSSRLNAAESMRAAALLNARANGPGPEHDDDFGSPSGSEVASEEFNVDVEILEAEGDTTVQSIESEASFAGNALADTGSSALPPVTNRRCSL